MDREQQRRIVEALVLASPEPITPARLAQIAPDCTPGLANELIDELNQSYQDQDRAFEIWKVAGGYQVRTRAEFSGYLQQLRKERPLRLSRAALEGLAIVAYRQPVTRGEIDDVRGVDTGAVIKSLMDRQLVRIVGQKDVPGRPMLYGTSRRFLEVFGLESLKKLPTLRELEEIARESGFVQAEGEDATAVAEDVAPAEGQPAAEGEAETASLADDEGDAEGPTEGDAGEPVEAAAEASAEVAALAADVPSESDGDVDEAEPEAAEEGPRKAQAD